MKVALLLAVAFVLALPGQGAATGPGRPGDIAFVTIRLLSKAGLFSVRPDGTSRRRIAGGMVSTAVASPDGSRIAWSDGDVWVDLAAVFRTTYERGKYARSIDYKASPPVALDADRLAWIAERARPAPGYCNACT